MFFFFFDAKKYIPGNVCRVIRGHNAGNLIVVHQVTSDMLWCYDNKPVKYKTNRNGDKVIEFDPACFMSPYSAEDLEITNDIPLQDGGWGATYRNSKCRLRVGL